MQFSCRVLFAVPAALSLATATVEDSGVEHHRNRAQTAGKGRRPGRDHTQDEVEPIWSWSSEYNMSTTDSTSEDSDPPDTVKYGPEACVSTWRSGEGHCIVQTDCKEEDIGGYNFGLVCVDKSGRPVKHVFGEGAFDPSERFDTLISCDECLGLENLPEEVHLNNDLSVVGGMVGELHADMAGLGRGLSRLNAAVFTPAPGPAAPAPAAADPPAAAPAPAVQFVSHRRKSRSDSRRVVRHKRKTGAHRQNGSGHRRSHSKAKAAHQGHRQSSATPTAVRRAGKREETQQEVARPPVDEERESAEEAAQKAYAAIERRNRIARMQRSRLQAHQESTGGSARPIGFLSDSQLRR